MGDIAFTLLLLMAVLSSHKKATLNVLSSQAAVVVQVAEVAAVDFLKELFL
jgi:hypothetical protein